MIQIQVHLQSDDWTKVGHTHARGYAHLDGRYLPAHRLAQILDACASFTDWRELVKRLNGCFAVVSEHDGHTFVAVDRIRSIPLFYASREDLCIVSDQASLVLERMGRCDVNPQADAEFKLTGYVTGRETLYAGVHQVEAGELLEIDTKRPSAVEGYHYYRFHHHRDSERETTELISDLAQVHQGVFRRLVESVEGRTMLIPLSGGYDSRLIGVSLRDMGVRDVICYSYGVPGNWESRISRELAQYLGFKWEFIAYSADRWKAWASLDAFQAYFLAAGNLASVPHIQDWPAVHELQSNNRIPPDSVFVPGHSGDFLAGSHIPKWYVKQRLVRREQFFDSLLEAHYSLWDWPTTQRSAMREQFKHRIEDITGPIQDCTPEQAADLFERWDLQERQAKFICNSMRVYESFGYEWRLPLFDYELMQFWESVSVERRTARKLYFEFVKARQMLPVTEANKDHSVLISALLKAVEAVGLRPAAKCVQRMTRRILWRREYDQSPLAWYALFDPEVVRLSYTGKELFYSYLSARYRDLVVGG